MARMSDPVKGKKSVPTTSKKTAIAKATMATGKAERGVVAPKSRYPQMSSASGAAAAAKRGSGAERSKMGGFGKTAARPMISNEGKVANQAARRSAIVGARKAASSKAAAASSKNTATSGKFAKSDSARRSVTGVMPMTTRSVSSRQAEDRVVSRRKASNAYGTLPKKITRLPKTK